MQLLLIKKHLSFPERFDGEQSQKGSSSKGCAGTSLRGAGGVGVRRTGPSRTAPRSPVSNGTLPHPLKSASWEAEEKREKHNQKKKPHGPKGFPQRQMGINRARPLPPTADPILPQAAAPFRHPPTPSTSHQGRPPPTRGRYSQGDRPVGQRLGRQDLSELQVAANYLHLHRPAGRRCFAGALGATVVLASRGQHGAAAAPQHRQEQERGQEPCRATGARRAAGSSAAGGQHGGAVQGPAPFRSSRRRRGRTGSAGPGRSWASAGGSPFALA